MVSEGKRIRAIELEPGCTVKVRDQVDGTLTLADVQAVRYTDTGIEADLRTYRPLRCPDVAWRSNFWTVTAGRDDPVVVSHLPSESLGDIKAAHGEGQIR